MSAASIYSRMRASGRLWNSLLVVLDAGLVATATALAYFARFEGAVPEAFMRWMAPLIGVSAALYIGAFAVTGLYRLVLRYVGVDTLMRLAGAVAACFVLLLAADLLLPLHDGMRPIPIGVLFIQALLVFLGASATRLAARVLMHVRFMGSAEGRRMLIIGAGSAGSLLLREIQARPDLGLSVAGFLDDDPALTGRTLNGVPVLGTTTDLAETVKRLDVEEIVVALPAAPGARVRQLLNAAASLGIQTRVMPSIVIAKGSVSIRDLRPVDVEDLLGREPTPIDVEQVRETIAGKVVAVTGAAGSIGSELCRQIMSLEPARLHLIDIDETRLYELLLALEPGAPGVAEMHLCDIRDAAKVNDVFSRARPELVLHAAAYKHVPVMELEPGEAVKTNVLGTRTVLEACERAGVSRFVLISTDKAVEPRNVMGLTKAIAERLMLDATRRESLDAVAVRFGNVLGSRGSVVPIFEEQLRHGGPLTVTHADATRFFMTIPEASRLVLQAQAIGKNGDVFVLEMGEPVRIADLARTMIALSGVPSDIVYTGLRPGEKLHEELVSESERLIPTGRERIHAVSRVDALREDFAASVTRLIDAAVCGDDVALASAIEEIEPGFATRTSEG